MMALVLLRFAVLALAAHCMCWTTPAAFRVFRLQLDIRIATHLALFLCSASFFTFQATYFATGGSTNPGWSSAGRVFGLSLQFVALMVSTWLGGQNRLYRGFVSVFEFPGEALAITELARHDPATADLMADECRRLTALAVVHG